MKTPYALQPLRRLSKAQRCFTTTRHCIKKAQRKTFAPRLRQTALGVFGAALVTAISASGAMVMPNITQAQKQGDALSRLPILRAKLPNGLRVVMSPERSVPTVAIAVYYDVGSRNEAKGRSGFAHLFEHMMFQGSANVKKGEHFSLIMNRGGTLNGTTSVDRTNYFETLPSNELELGLWLEADRMRSLQVTKENFENQRQTVMEERRQSYENQPYMLSMLEINRLSYGDYWPYAHSTIGKMSDLQKAPLKAVQEFFELYYAPNNAVLSIAGDVDPVKTMQLVKKHFGEIKPSKVQPYTPPAFKDRGSELKTSMEDPLAKLSAFHISYTIPPSRTKDHYALELLGMVLGHGSSSRLYQTLVKKKELCQEISVGTDDRRGPDLFSFWAIMSKGKEAADARKVIDSEILEIQKRGVGKEELEKVRTQLKSMFVFGLQTNMARATQLAEYELYWGDANTIRSELGQYLAVTSDDLKRVAKTYLIPKKRTVLDVLPKASAK